MYQPPVELSCGCSLRLSNEDSGARLLQPIQDRCSVEEPSLADEICSKERAKALGGACKRNSVQ